jgi:hypothetical protein
LAGHRAGAGPAAPEEGKTRWSAGQSRDCPSLWAAMPLSGNQCDKRTHVAWPLVGVAPRAVGTLVPWRVPTPYSIGRGLLLQGLVGRSPGGLSGVGAVRRPAPNEGVSLGWARSGDPRPTSEVEGARSGDPRPATEWGDLGPTRCLERARSGDPRPTTEWGDLGPTSEVEGARRGGYSS